MSIKDAHVHSHNLTFDSCSSLEQKMQSNPYLNRHGSNVELYREVFRVLDDLGMADLKLTFQEHCIQVLRLKKNDSDNNRPFATVGHVTCFSRTH